MDVTIDMVAVIQNDELRQKINEDLRERCSLFRIVLLSVDDVRNEVNVRARDDLYSVVGWDRRDEPTPSMD